MKRRDFISAMGGSVGFALSPGASGNAVPGSIRNPGVDNPACIPQRWPYLRPYAAAVVELVRCGTPKAAIALDVSAGVFARRAGQIFQSRVEQRTKARLPITSGSGSSANCGEYRVVIAAPESGILKLLGIPRRAIPNPEQLDREGFLIKLFGQNILVLALDGPGMIFAVGKLLHAAEYTDGSMFVNPPEGIERPVMAQRYLYMPPHLNNFYQVEEAGDIEPIIEEAALWGVNGISFWLDQGSFTNDPFSATTDDGKALKQWKKIKTLLQFAQHLGLKAGMVVCANDAYKNQLTPDVVTKAGVSWNSEKLINPTVPAGRKLLLRNRENLIRDLASSGIRLSSLLVFPYDSGGCFDQACWPWILTYLRLSEEYAGLLTRYHPGAETFVTDWFCNEDEAQMMVEYFNSHHGTALCGIWKQDRTRLERFVDLDPSYPIYAFVDISNMGGWGVIGAQPLPTMVHYYVSRGSSEGITGLMIYSEGIYDDFNKALAAQLAWDPAIPPEEVAREYATYFFQAPVGKQFWEIVERCEQGWVDTRIAWPKHQFIDVPVRAEELKEITLSLRARLAPDVRSSWRWKVFEYRAQIGLLAAGLRTAPEFRADILRAFDAGVAKELLWRRVVEKQKSLELYQQLVTELRVKVYHEPVSRFPSMMIDGSWMTQVIQVPAAQWKKIFAELGKKLGSSNG
jgi:hypothetical protein